MKKESIACINDNFAERIKIDYINHCGILVKDKMLVVGIRATNGKVDEFDDLFVDVALNTNGISKVIGVYPGTTDPGKSFLRNPMYPRGTAIVKKGFYKNVWAYGFHRNDKSHPALKQVGSIRLILDSNRNDVMDIYDTSKCKEVKYLKDGVWTYDYMLGDKLIQREICTATAGINNHRANRWSIAKLVDVHSAGCQVIQKYSDHEKHMNDVVTYINKGQNLFDYYLIDEADI